MTQEIMKLIVGRVLDLEVGHGSPLIYYASDFASISVMRSRAGQE